MENHSDPLLDAVPVAWGTRQCGVYFVFSGNGGALLYIGKAHNIDTRFHKATHQLIDVRIYEMDKKELARVEKEMIKKYSPLLNIMHTPRRGEWAKGVNKQVWARPGFRERHKAAMDKARSAPEFHKKRSAASRLMWERAEYRSKRAASISKNKKPIAIKEQRIVDRSTLMKQIWESHREKIIHGMKTKAWTPERRAAAAKMLAEKNRSVVWTAERRAALSQSKRKRNGQGSDAVGLAPAGDDSRATDGTDAPANRTN